MLIGRAAVLLALLVACTGRVVHQHALDGACCDHSHDQTAAKSTSVSCPFGCKHHASDAAGNSSQPTEAPQEPHDHHTCPVCSVLATAPPVPTVTVLPERVERPALPPPASVQAPVTELAITCLTRGPPAIVS